MTDVKTAPQIKPLARRKPHRSTRLFASSGVAWLLVLPAVMLIAAVTLLPMLETFKLSLHETNFLETGKFVGLGQFVKYLSAASGLNDILVTLVFSFGSIAIAMPLALGLAILLNKPITRANVLSNDFDPSLGHIAALDVDPLGTPL